MNARRNVPNVDGAFTPGSTLPTAPSRNPSMSKMLSAPATIPATIETTFAAALAPPHRAEQTARSPRGLGQA